jgi:hypothetical protein
MTWTGCIPVIFLDDIKYPFDTWLIDMNEISVYVPESTILSDDSQHDPKLARNKKHSESAADFDSRQYNTSSTHIQPKSNNIVEILRRIPKDRVAEMQQAIKKIAQHLQYTHPTADTDRSTRNSPELFRDAFENAIKELMLTR